MQKIANETKMEMKQST